MGLTWIPRAFEPYHDSCMSCGCIFSLTSSPWVPYFMCSCALPSSGRLGPSRAEVGIGFRCVRLVQALSSSPPSAGLVPCPSASAFLFPCPFRVCPLRARCVVLVFSLSLVFWVPLFAFWLSNCHFIVIFISLSLSFHPPRCCGMCVCVCAWVWVRVCVYRCKTSYFCRGATAHLPMFPNEATEDVLDGFMDAWTCTCIIFIYIVCIYIYIVPPLGANKSQLGGTYILSLLFYTVNVYCDYTSIYYCIRSHSLCQFIVGVFARPLHSTSEFAKTVLSKCVFVRGSCVSKLYVSKPAQCHKCHTCHTKWRSMSPSTKPATKWRSMSPTATPATQTAPATTGPRDTHQKITIRCKRQLFLGSKKILSGSNKNYSGRGKQRRKKGRKGGRKEGRTEAGRRVGSKESSKLERATK